MNKYAEFFSDFVLVDTTYKRNRFNLPLVNLVGVDNFGKTIVLGFGMISDEKIESYDWFFGKLKECWQRSPQVFICDEDASIHQGNFVNFIIIDLLGIRNHFSSKIHLCGWHLQKNICSHLSSVSKKNKDLYNKALSLPFITDCKKFEKIYDELKISEDVSETQVFFPPIFF